MNKVMDEEIAKRSIDEWVNEIQSYHHNLDKECFIFTVESLQAHFEESFSREEKKSLYIHCSHLSNEQWIRLCDFTTTFLRPEYGLPPVNWFIEKAYNLAKQEPMIIVKGLS